MGFQRSNPKIEDLSKRLTMGVRADRSGEVLTDLQIVSSNSNPFIDRLCDSKYKHRVGEGGLLTYRQYLQDCCFTVVLSGEPSLLQKITYAINNPVFPAYFGAKSCVPARPIFEVLTDEYESIDDALERYDLNDNNESNNINSKIKKYYCEIESTNGTHIRQDEINNNIAREYGFRRVNVKYVGGF